ncbi:MAG: c-type cytochrome, partial [Magnetospirillum sp.]|nr:c-type cytochrome [Magnetospirillum sp.]
SPPAPAPLPPPAADSGIVLPNGKPWVYDPETAKDIMRTCAACHGEFGEGGGGGVYPRLAGLNAEYLADQLRRFKSRERENIPMVPYATDRELPEKEVLDIARFLADAKVAKYPPPPEVAMDAYQRLKATKLTVQIPREPGDVEAGKALWDSGCLECHGRQGQGRGKKPMLAGQHMAYLKTQIALILAGRRKHEDIDELMRGKSEDDWQNLWAYVSILDD